MDRRELDEYIEVLWYLSEEGEPAAENLKEYQKFVFKDEVLDELVRSGLITIKKDKKIELTTAGYDKARQIVRCHRLAERLLVDVLGMPVRETEAGACEFEHIIASEITDSICTLLGHPRECPHGFKIPEGECCKKAQDTITSAIVSLDKIKVGEEVKVAYIRSPSNSRMHKLSHFGIIPGAYIKIHQRYPSFVIQCGNTQLAMEEDIAKEVFVLNPSSADSFSVNEPVSKRHRFRGFKL